MLSVDNVYLRAALNVLIIMYGSTVAVNLPPFLQQLFRNPVFRVLVIALLAYVISKDLQIGIITTIVFLVSLTGLKSMEEKETFDQLERLFYIEAFIGQSEKDNN